MALARKKYKVDFGYIEVGEMGRRNLMDALDSKWISGGKYTKLLEERFAKKFGYPYAIATSSGTDAGIVAAASLYDVGAKRGDEIITPALAFVATANCVLAAGMIPKFVEVDINTLNIDPTKIEETITPKTRAIQVVHTMGKVAKMDQILDIAKRHNLVIIEDCCEAHGATLKGKVVGSFGQMALFSFYVAHIIASGEGGMVTANDAKFADACRSIHTHGRRHGDLYFNFDRIGFNSKMNDLEAAIALEGLDMFDGIFAYRQKLIKYLLDKLTPLEDKIILYREDKDEVMCPHAFSFVMRDEKQDMKNLHAHFEKWGIESKVLFGCLPTQHKAFNFLGHKLGDFPISERIGRTGITLGIHQYLKFEDLDYIADSIKAYFGAK
jgi:dTDP-4-amino-4,6-dideoxygalactose transaminase